MPRYFIQCCNLLSILVLFLYFAAPAWSQNKIVGPKQCSDSNCHSNIFEHNQKHPHETFFNTRYEEDGVKIAKKMKVEDHFEDKKCIRCHGTEVASKYPKIAEEQKGLFGVICETCHNPAEDWIEIHDKKGKISAAVEKGMRPTRDLYQWSIHCFNCHRGVDENYFNAGHKMGDKFNLTRYSQGDFKHWDWSKEEKEKGDLDKKLQVKLGKIWLTGEAFQIQYSLERMAESAKISEFTKKNFALLQGSMQNLEQVSQILPSGQLTKILTLVDSVNPSPQSASAVLAKAKELIKEYIHEVDQATISPADFSALPVPNEASFIRIKKK